MTEVQAFILSLLSAVGVSTALSGLLIWLARNWIGERLRNSIKHEYDLKLSALNNELRIQANAQATQLKSSIEREAEKIRFATSSIGESQKAAISRKLDSIETLWSGVLNARENVPTVMGFIDILSVGEYLSFGDHPQFKKMIGEFSPEKLTKIFKDNTGSLERIRPYVGEYLWALYSTYQALVIRVVMLIQMGEKDPKKLNWHEDSGVRQLLDSSLTKQEVEKFDSAQIGKFAWVQRTYETKILLAMQKVISGQEFGEESLRQAQEMEAKIQEVKQKA